MSEAGSAITRFDFMNGPLRGSHLTLYSNCLVHRGAAQLETFPLAVLASVRVEFARKQASLRWGAAWIVVALLLLTVSAPLAAFAGSAAAEMAAAGGQGVTRALQSLFRLLESGANLFPLLAAAAALGGAALAVLGWLGNTTLTLTIPGYERAYPARGHDTQLLDFADALSDQLMALKR